MRILTFFFAASMLFAQLESNTVTVTATRTVTVQPDQVVFTVSVLSPPTASIDDVLAMLQGSGITASQFSGVSGPLQLSETTGISVGTSSQLLQWTFSLPEPVGQFKATAATLS